LRKRIMSFWLACPGRNSVGLDDSVGLDGVWHTVRRLCMEISD
jgi:hypothetical protein